MSVVSIAAACAVEHGDLRRAHHCDVGAFQCGNLRGIQAATWVVDKPGGLRGGQRLDLVGSRALTAAVLRARTAAVLNWPMSVVSIAAA